MTLYLILGILAIAGGISYLIYLNFQENQRTRQLIRAIHIDGARERAKDRAFWREHRLENQQWYKDFSIWLRRIDEKVDPEG